MLAASCKPNGHRLNVSTKTNATQYTAMTKRMSEWNDGAFLKLDSDPIKVADWLWRRLSSMHTARPSKRRCDPILVVAVV